MTQQHVRAWIEERRNNTTSEIAASTLKTQEWSSEASRTGCATCNCNLPSNDFYTRHLEAGRSECYLDVRDQATTRASPVPQVARLPRKVQLNLAKCHACRMKVDVAKCHATQTEAATTPTQARHQSQPKCRQCHTCHAKWGSWSVTKCHACHAEWRSMSSSATPATQTEAATTGPKRATRASPVP